MFGVCYYPEHWPEDMWAGDAAQMAALGLRVVRIGEFSWSRLEPEAGQFRFEWLDRAIAVLADAGLGVVLGTPTATPPKWLIDAHPEILPVDPETGRVRGFGSRRHYDFSSPVYRRESLRITAAMAARYGDDARVIGWQTDNEIGCHDSTVSGSDRALTAFRSWCRDRYRTIATLNEAWGNVFWSMEYPDFDAIELPYGAVTETNPAHRLAYRRFASDELVDFHAQMTAVLRAHCGDQFVTHNFIPVRDTNADVFAIAAPLDFPSYDSYPLGRTDVILHGRLPRDEFAKFQRTGHPDLSGLALDQTRGLGNGPFWIMEQQPGPVNWAYANPAPAPGMIRLWSFEAFAHGADCVSFFRWRQAPFAQEQMHAGLRKPDDSPSRRWAEFDSCIREITALALTELAMAKASVAVILDPVSEWVTDIERQGSDYDLQMLEFRVYSALRGLGLDVDIISADTDFSGYKIIVAPCLAITNDDFAKRATESGALFVFGPRSGAKTSDFRIPATLAPGPLAQHVGATVAEVETLRKELPLHISWQGHTYTATAWREWLDCADTEVLGRYDDGSAAVVRHGQMIYVATLPSEHFWSDFLAALCAETGVENIRLPATLRLRQRGDVTFAFNYGAEAAALPLQGDERFVVGGPTIDAFGVAAWRPR